MAVLQMQRIDVYKRQAEEYLWSSLQIHRLYNKNCEVMLVPWEGILQRAREAYSRFQNALPDEVKK